MARDATESASRGTGTARSRGRWHDIDRAERFVLELGGTKLAERPDDEPPFRVYADPAGHPFCLEYPSSAR